MDSLGFAMDSFIYALDKIERRPQSPQEIKQYFGASADKIFYNYLKDSKLANQAFELFLAHQRELALHTKIHDGMLEVLNTLKQLDYRLAIVTGRHALDLDILLKPHGLADYFEVCVADSDVSEPKPSAEGINLVLQKMGASAEQAFYVGDSAVDIRAAHRAGVMAIAALWDAHAHREELLAEKPNLLIESPSEILNIF